MALSQVKPKKESRGYWVQDDVIIHITSLRVRKFLRNNNKIPQIRDTKDITLLTLKSRREENLSM